MILIKYGLRQQLWVIKLGIFLLCIQCADRNQSYFFVYFVSVGVQIIYIVSMLQPVPASEAITSKEAYFYDIINNQLFYLHQGTLKKRDLSTQQQQTIPINLSSVDSRHQPSPVFIASNQHFIVNVDRNVATMNSDQEVTLRISREVINGSYWQWHLPLTLEGVELGICKMSNESLLMNELISFNSSTARTVSFFLNENELSFWVNGTRPLKVSSKTLKFDSSKNEKIYPCASLKGKGSLAAFWPFFSQPELLGVSEYNPFGQLYSQVPNIIQPQAFQSPKLKISKLIQLSNDRLLIIWQNNTSRIFYRNKDSLRFSFDSISVHENSVKNLFSGEQYNKIKAWRGAQPLFSVDGFNNLLNAFQWIRYLISKLDQQKSKQTELYKLLLMKLIALRPYLYSIGLQVPNLILQSEMDRQPFELASKYFNLEHKNEKFLVPRQFNQYKLEGQIKDFTQNYLITQIQHTFIIYYIGDNIKQVSRFTTQNLSTFTKRALLEQFQETDLGYLKNQSTFLFKILMGCLNKERKVEQVHVVNQNDLNQLIKDFGIKEEIARIALERTGNVQEALVWIYTQKQEQNLKKLESLKEEHANLKDSISLLELKSMFGRLVLLLNGSIYILGMLPSDLKKWIHRGENEFIDLASFKHQNHLKDIEVEKWFRGNNHAPLTILDKITSVQTPTLIFRQKSKVYGLYSGEAGSFKREIILNFENIYQQQSSLSYGEEAMPVELYQNSFVRTLKGEIITAGFQNRYLEEGSTVFANNKLYTNESMNQQEALKIVIQTDLALNIQEGKAEAIPLKVLTGPPGINKNYSISSILLPKSKFLANYPHGFSLSHLHNKLIRPTTFHLKRSISQKNINYITSGNIYLVDIWGRKSQQFSFHFEQNAEEITLNFPGSQYWSKIFVSAKYTTQKKLPFQIGTVLITGHDISEQSYKQQYYQHLTKMLSSLDTQLSIVSYKPINNNAVEIVLTSSSLIVVENALNSSSFNLKSKQSVVLDRSYELQSLDILQPSQIIKKIIAENHKTQTILRQLANSYLFSLKHFSEEQVYKFIDLVLYYSKSIESQNFYESIFSKIWYNQHGKKYLNKLANSLTEVPILPLPFLTILIKKLNSNQLQEGIKSSLKSISNAKSNLYQKIKSNEQSYLYYETEFYSNYYYGLIEPSLAQSQASLFTEPLIKSQIAVLKSDYSRRAIVKLPAQYHITNVLLKVQRSQTLSKFNYSIYGLNSNKKQLISEGRVYEHQWTELTRFSSKIQIQQIYGQSSKNFNALGLSVPAFTAQYVQIELNFTETGIISHNNQSGKVPQIDILPQLYGFQINKSAEITTYDWLFNNKAEDMFFLSVSTLGRVPLQKYSVTKGRNIEFLYYETQKEDLGLFKRTLEEKIKKNELDSIVTLQKKLIKNGSFSHLISLDYLYTLFILISGELLKREEKLPDNVCEDIYNIIVLATQGPIKIAGFKALSHKIPLLLKSLHYIESELPSLGTINFSYEQLLEVLDFNNADLCKSLSRLILRGVAYQQKWVQLLIKLSHLAQNHKEIISYFVKKEDWLQNNVVLDYLFNLPEEIFIEYFLGSISYQQLCKLVLTPNAKPQLQMLLEVIVERASAEHPLDLDVVSLLFQQQEVRWQQLERVIISYPEATDMIIHQYLQTDTPEKLASNHYILLSTAAQLKYAEQFADFLDKIYKLNKTALGEVFTSLIGKCTSLHYDFLQTIVDFIVESCDFGGVQGIILVTQTGLVSVNAAVQMLKVVQKLPEGAILPNENSLIRWYLRNNDYEFTSGNPANKSAGYHLMRHLVQYVLNLLKASSPVNVLNKYSEEIKVIQHSKKLSFVKKHLFFNQIHHGASELLSHTLTPGSLGDVLVGSQNPLLTTIINELKATTVRKSRKADKWKPNKEIDITEKFTVVDAASELKDIQLGKTGSKNAAYKIPVTTKNIKFSAEEVQHPSKFVIGFVLNDLAQNKTAVLPSKVELVSGNGKATVRVGEMSLLDDQFFLQFGVKVFGLNLNNFDSHGINSVKNLQFRFHQPNFASVSELLQSGQKFKKGSVFSLSFVGIFGYDQQPTEQPDYSHLYVTLLGFLGQKKYHKDLKAVLSSPQFDQKLQLIIQVLNDLLPNESIQNLLLALNSQGENILQHILRSKSANPRLVSMLVLGRLTKDNINKLIAYTLDNMSAQFANIVVQSLRLASYAQQQKDINLSVSNFQNLKLLIQKWQRAQGQHKNLYFKLLTSIITVPNVYNYEIGKLIDFIWNKSDRQKYYLLLAAILPYYPLQLKTIATKGYTIQLFDELLAVLKTNQSTSSIVNQPYNYIALLCSLVLQNSSKKELLERKAPIRIAELLKSETSLLIQYQNKTMKLFLNFFQSTCIGTCCQQAFCQILISLMTSLNDFNPSYHYYFIHSFFFPLINAFKGVPVVFVWKYGKTYLKQINDLFRDSPIKSNVNVIKYQDDYYHPIETLDASSLTQKIIFLQKDTKKVSYKLLDGVLFDLVANKSRKYSSNEGKIVAEIDAEHSVTISNDKYSAYILNQWEKHLLTNATLVNLENPWILQENYRSFLAIQQSTPERCYFLPAEMKLNELLGQINIGGLTIRPVDIQKIVPLNRHNGKELTLTTTLKEIIDSQEQPYLKVEIQASKLFESTSIETLTKEQPVKQSFVALQTIFKAFEEKKGLQKMITVLKGCVKNWVNAEQSNIWGQYLKQLQSYSCFPVFSSLYMTKQSNVGLLFDLLLGLPEKQDNKKWLQKQKESVRDLYLIIKDVFAVKGQQAKVVREYAVKSGFYSTMLDRLHIITKETKRFKSQEQVEEQEVLQILEKKNSDDEDKKTLTKKKGVGYGTDSSSNQKWDLTGHEEARKQKSEQILGLLKILEQFLDNQEFEYPPQLLNQTLESSLLPIIESSLRGGSLLEISKYAELFQGQLSFIQVLARCKNLIPTLMPIPKFYEPKQIQPIHSLLKTLANTSKIFLSCLTGSASQKVSEEIAKKTIQTFEIVEQAIESYEVAHNDEQEQKKILELPLAKKYPLLMKDLRFDYIDMKDNTGKISKHHYSSSYQAGHKPPVQKTIRLAQELADISHALPIDHTNAIYVRCDKERVDFMQALIMGSNGTPYGHGAYLFDIHFEDNYPNGPPKVNLTTTGNGQIRFNPNLYACGKVCLSLLGTWRGNATQNWDAKVSTLLQVLVSIQSIIMSEDIYFNEPGFQHEQGTPEGEKKNEAYANIVRYGNVKFAMTDNIKNPPKGFESVIRRHFYLKKDEIMEQCRRWLKLAEKREASYNGLVNDHNYNWCNNFKKSKTEYKTMLEKAVKELQVELNKLPPPTHEDFKKETSPTKQKKKVIKKKKENEIENEVQIQDIDVSYGGAKQFEELDINDERVKDRWSRYIGAMGVQAVSKQSKASILLLGMGPVGVQIAKNIVLSGCRELALWDDKVVEWSDLSGQFFLGQSDVGNSRLESTFYKLQQLNHYVKLSKFDYNSSEFSNISRFQVVIATQRIHSQLVKLNAFCRSNKIHFLSVDCYGPYGQIFNDFGDSFEVLDKNGEQTIEVILQEITVGEKGIVRLPKGHRHPFQDGETVRIAGVKGMKSLNNENSSINGTLHKIRVIDQNSFEIGDTSNYSPYEGDGTARNLKTPSLISFKSLEASAQLQNIDSNLEVYDWAKCGNLKLLHSIFITLSTFRQQKNRLPLAWNKQQANQLVQFVKQIKHQLSQAEVKYIKLFSYTCSGNFGSICALFGGLASQEAFKAITGKYTPINQYFLAEFSEILQTPPESEQLWNQFIASYQDGKDRREGLRRIIGSGLLKKLQNARVFMVGSGAIGCELLKNFAMLQVGAGQNGNIVVTDPDHIQTSNLNRQFLFRQKHIRKPKSATAIAAVSQMNPRLKGHIKARLDKVCEATKDIFTNQFFESQTIIANALDNVQARRYVDSRCVQNKVPLLQSGTLSSKGHVQVIIPYKTETYGSKQDPNDAQGDIPLCTLKMFPEETLHCIEWARDLFGKEFTLGPKALRKLLQQGQKYVPSPSDIQMLKDCLKLVQRRPNTFDDAIEVATKLFYQFFRNDILQLLYTYPLDAKTKDGKPFWKLPKRPPFAIQQIFPEDPLHATFIASFSVLLARVYNVPYPKDFRDPKKRQQIAKIASRIKVEQFVPSDKLAQEMTSEVNKQSSGQQATEEVHDSDESQTHLYNKFIACLAEFKENGESLESKPQQFQKDEDQNGHIDLIYSMANLRARNYKLQEMQWINVKLKAGRIMPALSTTTSCIAALQTIELVKYLRGCPLQAMRNAFINLAVPYMQLGQPGPVQKIKVHEKLETTLWERWSIGPISSSTTLGEMMGAVEQKYGITVKGLSFAGGSQVYSDFVFSLQSKKEEKQKLLNKKLQTILSDQLGQQASKFADFTLVMGVGQTLIKHAPTLRLLLEG